VEIFGKDFFQIHNSKRGKKNLSSSDFVTVAELVQQDQGAAVRERRGRRHETGTVKQGCGLPVAATRFARLRWVIYTSHSPCSHYCTD
jgi:hypothetical protein